MVGLSCALLSFGVPTAAAERSPGAAVVPADGRLNTPDFMAKVTSVAWPATNAGQEPHPGRRFVTFTLEVAALSESASPTSQAATLSAALRWDGTISPFVPLLDPGRDPVRRRRLEHSECQRVVHGDRAQHHARRRSRSLRRHLLAELRPVDASARRPVARRPLPRSRPRPRITGNAAAPAMLALSNPSDGFTSSADGHAPERDARLRRAERHDPCAKPRPSRALGRARRGASQRPERPDGLGSLPRVRAHHCPPACSASPRAAAPRRPPPSATPVTPTARAAPTTVSSTPPTRSSSRPRSRRGPCR